MAEEVFLEGIGELQMLIRGVLAVCFGSVLHFVTDKTAHSKVYERLSLLSN